MAHIHTNLTNGESVCTACRKPITSDNYVKVNKDHFHTVMLLVD